MAAAAEQIVLDELRPRAAGRAPRADQRRCSSASSRGPTRRDERRAAAIRSPPRSRPPSRVRSRRMAGTTTRSVPQRARRTATGRRGRSRPTRTSPRAAPAGCSACPGRARQGAWPARSRSRIPVADLDERDPDYIRERLPGAVAAVEPVLPRRGPRPGQHPRGGAGPAGRQPLRRQPHARHAASSRWPSARTSASSARFYQLAHNLVAVDARAWASCASSAPSRRRPTTRARRWSPARRCSSTPAATTRSTGPSWERNKVDFGGRKGFIRLALEQDVPIVPVVADRRPGDRAVPLARRDARAAARCSTRRCG